MKIMYLNLLLEVLNGAAPETKYFLIQYLRKYGFQTGVILTVKDAVTVFRMNDRTISKALNFLTENRYLDRLKVEPDGGSSGSSSSSKGRRKSRYSPGLALLALKDNWSAANAKFSYQVQIDSLLSEKLSALAGCRNEAVSSRGELTKSQLMLLSTLLAHADERGIVECLSLSQLALLIGLSKEQIRWNIKVLQRCGCLVRYIPGGTVRREMGRRLSAFVISSKLLTDAHQSKHPFVSVRFEMRYVLRKSVQLAVALMDAHEGDSREVRKSGKAQYHHWNALYHVSTQEYEDILEHIELYLQISGGAVLVFDRFNAAIYTCVEQLVRDYGFGLLDADQEFEHWESYFSLVLQANNFKWISNKDKSARWFINWVFEFYEELRCLSLDDRCDMQIRSIRIRPILQDNVLIQVA